MQKHMSVPNFVKSINAYSFPVWIIRYDDITFHSINISAEKEFLYPEEELLGRSMLEICPYFSKNDLYTTTHAKSGSKVVTTIKRKDGKEQAAELNISNFIENGEYFFYISITPLSLLHANPDKTVLTSFFYQQSFMMNFVPIIVADKNTQKILQVNEGAMRLYGYSRDEFLNLCFYHLYPSTDIGISDKIFKVVREDRYNRFEAKHIASGNRIVDVELYIQPIKSFNGYLLMIMIVDISEKKLALKLLEESLNNYKIIAGNSTDLILRHTISGQITYASPASIRLLGYKPGELTLENVYNFIHPGDADRIRAGLLSMIDTVHYKARFRIINSKGKYRWFESTAKILPDNSMLDSEREIISVSRDVTDRVEIENQLLEANKKAGEISRLKDIILANMSHEMRTPLQSILGYTEIIKEKINDQDLLNDLEIIHSDSKRLLRMINLFLNLTYLEAKNFIPYFEAYNVSDILRNVAESFISTAEQKGLYLRVKLDNEPSIVFTDRILLRDVLDNVIDNAIKFTHDGGVDISSFREEKDGRCESVIQIKDTGIGIQKEKENILFQEFRQASEGLDRKFEGIGLGLTISKKIIEKLNGKMYMQSSSNGTTINIYFPIKK